MAVKDISYYKKKLLALRRALDATLGEMEEEENVQMVSPRKRRNLKNERVEEFEVSFALGTWSKPKALKKKG